jgi:hypothetical protein
MTEVEKSADSRSKTNAYLGGLAAAFVCLASSSASAGTAQYEFLATLMAPCIYNTDNGGIETTAGVFGLQPQTDTNLVPHGQSQKIWRFPTTDGALYVSVPLDHAKKCTLTAYGVRTVQINAELLRAFGQPVEQSFGDTIHEVFKMRTGGLVTVDLWPLADSSHPSVVAEYVSPSASSPTSAP